MIRYAGRNYVIPSFGWEHSRAQRMYDQVWRNSAVSAERAIAELNRRITSS